MPHSPLTPAVFHILLALADGPLHGYAIMQAAESTAGVAMDRAQFTERSSGWKPPAW